MADRMYTARPALLLTIGASPSEPGSKLLQLVVPSTCPAVKIIEVGCEPFGILSTAEKARIRLVRLTAAATGTDLTPMMHDSEANIPAKTTAKHTLSAGTFTDVVWETMIHLQSGQPYRLDHLGIYVPSGGIIALCVINGATASTCLPRISWRE